jgi:hypothetical protein
MAGERHNLQLKLQRSGWFNEHRVDGWQFEDERGKLAWHIRTWPNSGDPIDDYWVEGSVFYEVVRLDLAMNMIPMNQIETGGRITGMDASKRDAVLNAIAEWEKPLEVQAE